MLEQTVRISSWHQCTRPNADTPSLAAATLPGGALELLVIQPSPFCNLDCSYCYLPNRDDSSRMSLDVLSKVLRKVARSGLTRPQVSIVWHAGEPMVVPRKWYEAAFEIAASELAGMRLVHHFQTNAVLIDAAWCEFFVRHGVRVGVSVDGPAAIHDLHRRTRDGRPTHAKVMAGIAQLRAGHIPFHAICVLTRCALENVDAILDFFVDLDPEQVGFNVEEIEAGHDHSSLQGAGVTDAMRAFWKRMLQRLSEQPRRLRVREVEMVLAALRDPQYGQHRGNSQNQLGRMLNIGYDGSHCFWSPELLGAWNAQRGAIGLGNLASCDKHSWPGLALAAQWQHEIDAGVRRCRAECAYFDFCMGGAPSNKLAELGSFDGTETMACRLGLQMVVDAVLQELDRQLPPLVVSD